jgi:hypothetical protein
LTQVSSGQLASVVEEVAARTLTERFAAVLELIPGMPDSVSTIPAWNLITINIIISSKLDSHLWLTFDFDLPNQISPRGKAIHFRFGQSKVARWHLIFQNLPKLPKTCQNLPKLATLA